MGEPLFGRNARLRVGETNILTRDIDRLRISFKITRTSEANPNRGSISIYNLNNANRDFLQQDREKGKELKVNLLTGYGRNLRNTFIGTVNRVQTVKEGPDIITTIQAGDGENEFRDSTTNKSFSVGTNFLQVIQQLVSDIGLPLANPSVAAPTVFNKGVSISGSSAQELTKYLKQQNLEWSIQDERIEIKPQGFASGIDVVFLTSGTGLLGSPMRRDKGLEFKSFHNARLKPGAPVIIQSREFVTPQTFVLRKVIHNGDTREGPWESVCEAI